MKKLSKLITNIKKVRQLRNFKVNYHKIRKLKYMHKDKLHLRTFAKFKKSLRTSPFAAEEQARPVFPDTLKHLQEYSAPAFPKGKVLVLVNHALYPSVKASIDTYVQDLAYEGYFAVVYRVQGEKEVDLRNFLRSKMPMQGAFMVGALPVAWFEMEDEDYGHEEFPCDLYFMDLKGTWTDTDKNGKFDLHAVVVPEIWVSRLWTPKENGNDAALINDYFKRNHLYRKGLFGASNQALAFVDDDWVGADDEYGRFEDCSFGEMFPMENIESINEPMTTNAARYKAEVQQFRAWAQICAHSSHEGHWFQVGNDYDFVPNTYLRDINPPNAFFYNLFACSHSLFTEEDYMAGWYIFGKDNVSVCNGLTTVGSTKIGSMLFFENFYGPMDNGKVIGDAYLDWWKALGDEYEDWMLSWFYGMALLGDPTLNWWNGFVPNLRNPHEKEVFDHHPRLTTFQWDPVPVSGATYNVEIDAFGAIAAGKWAAEANATWLVSGPTPHCTYEHLFIGAQRGRWRVRANVGKRTCPWSDWRYFNYTR